MRVKHAKKNVIYGTMTYVLLMALTFVNRRIFIDVLGQDMAGLQGLLQNLLSLLNLVESGVGMAIMFSLYKPFAEDDRIQIKSTVTLYSKIYKISGTILLVGGIILSGCLGIFVKNQIPMGYARICFILYIIDTTLTYYFSYKTCMLYASQSGYVISFWDFIFKFLRSAVQIIVLFVFKSFLVFILIQIITNIGYLVTINYIIAKKFPWFKTTEVSTVQGKDNIIKNIKALFIHKIGSFVVFGTDNIVISYFINLKTVAMYTNYSMVISFCQNFINKIFDGLTASIGNLLTEKDSEKAFQVFNKLMFLNFWISSFVTISLYNTLDDFVRIWLGKEFVLDNIVIIVLLMNFYITTMRMCIDKFKESGGLYYEDRYAPLFEITINLVFSIVLVNYIGLVGVFIGTLISNLTVIFWVKPKIVFKNVFNRGLGEYFKRYIGYMSLGIIPLGLTIYLGRAINFDSLFITFILKVILNIVVINLTYIIIFYRNKEFLYYKNLVMKKLGVSKFKN
ncbi:MAG: O-unit flippase [Clostridium sp.]|uniref:lipopolysaccharide biosynthesis protein n=1 Tax=Clostridium sp. TaxID=1506 RepID=UPI00302B90D8